MIDEHARRLAKLEAAFEGGSLDEDTYRAAVAALGGAQTSVAGAGSIAQHGGIAAGTGGVAAGTIQGNVYIGAPPRDDAEAVQIYCRVVAQTSGQLPMRGVDVGASDSDGDLVRCAARSWYSPMYRSYSVGFRVMLSPS